MKILVTISKVPDTTSKITFLEGNSKFNEQGIQWIVNPYDEWYALVRAVELKESNPDTIIHLISVGDAGVEPILRKAMAIGGDEMIRINKIASDSYDTANQIAEYAKNEAYDLIFTGKEAIDYNSGAVGPMIAELLDMPFLAATTKFDLNGSIVSITREIDGGEELNEVNTPIVVGCAKGLAKQRIPNMRKLMAVRTQTIKTIEPVDLPVMTITTVYELPLPKSGIKMIDPQNVDELVRLLHEEAKVI